MPNAVKKGILERLAESPVVGDGSMLLVLEKRGYCKNGPFTPEAVLKYPDAVEQLLREYLRAGSDVIQTPCYHSSDGKLEECTGGVYSTSELNNAACYIARKVANDGDALVCGGLSPVYAYSLGKGLEATQKEFEKQLEVFIRHDVDFLLGEFFGHIEELEIFVDVCKKTNKPVGCTMRLGPAGDHNGHSVEECAVRMARTGADIIGINCLFDVNTSLKTLRRIKDALVKENLNPYLMCQVIGWMCPEVENHLSGYIALPENPLALDPRLLTRVDVHKFARSAYELGVNYIGGCCGTEPHHIRAIAQELAPERKKDPPVQDMCPPHGPYLHLSMFSNQQKKRNNKEFWYNVKPGSGRPFNPQCSEPEESEYRITTQ